MVVWSTYDYEILTSSRVNNPIHELKWDPYTVNEFASVGANGTVLFWLLDETSSEVCLNVHEAEVPEELLQTHHMVITTVYIYPNCQNSQSVCTVSTSLVR